MCERARLCFRRGGPPTPARANSPPALTLATHQRAALALLTAARLSRRALHPAARFAASGGAPHLALGRAAVGGAGPRALATFAPASTAYASAEEHGAALAAAGDLPPGFRCGTHTFSFIPAELPIKPARMTLTLLALDAPTANYAAMFTRNAFPGAPVLVGRARLAAGAPLQAIVINNKVSNVCAPGGVAAAEATCAEAARLLGLASPSLVLPCSTGVIG